MIQAENSNCEWTRLEFHALMSTSAVTLLFKTAFLDLINFQTASDNTHYTCISMYVCVIWMYVFLLINVDFYTVNVD